LVRKVRTFKNLRVGSGGGDKGAITIEAKETSRL